MCIGTIIPVTPAYMLSLVSSRCQCLSTAISSWKLFPSTTQTLPRHNIFGYHLGCQISDIFFCPRACITMAGDSFVSRWSLPLCLPFAPGHRCLALMWFDITDVDDEWYNTHTLCCVLLSILTKSLHSSRSGFSSNWHIGPELVDRLISLLLKNVF